MGLPLTLGVGAGSVALVLALACSSERSSSDREVDRAMVLKSSTSRCGPTWVWDLKDRQDQVVIEDANSELPAALVTRGRIGLVALAVARYCLDHDEQFPQTTAAFDEWSAGVPRNTRCAPDPSYLSDGWGTPLTINWRVGPPEIESAGPDKVLGTDDDIRAPAPGETDALLIDPYTTCRQVGPG